MIHYDTIYAHQDREDDALVGLKSTALLFGDEHQADAGAVLGRGGDADRRLRAMPPAPGVVFALGLAAFAAHLAWQIVRIDIDDPDSCLRMFRSNRDAGLILFAALMLDAAGPAVVLIRSGAPSVLYRRTTTRAPTSTR